MHRCLGTQSPQRHRLRLGDPELQRGLHPLADQAGGRPDWRRDAHGGHPGPRRLERERPRIRPGPMSRTSIPPVAATGPRPTCMDGPSPRPRRRATPSTGRRLGACRARSRRGVTRAPPPLTASPTTARTRARRPDASPSRPRRSPPPLLTTRSCASSVTGRSPPSISPMTLSTPAGTTLRSQRTSASTAQKVVSANQATAGSTGSALSGCTIVSGTCGEWVAHTVVLKPPDAHRGELLGHGRRPRRRRQLPRGRSVEPRGECVRLQPSAVRAERA